MKSVIESEWSKEQLNELAVTIVKLTRADRDKAVRDYKKNSYKNTRELLEKYRFVKAHCEVVAENLEDDRGTFWEDGRLRLDAVVQNKAKAVKLLKIVDRSLEKYKILCEGSRNKDDQRKYEILKLKYLNNSGMSEQMIADRFNVDRTTINRNSKVAIRELSELLFGNISLAIV